MNHEYDTWFILSSGWILSYFKDFTYINSNQLWLFDSSMSMRHRASHMIKCSEGLNEKILWESLKRGTCRRVSRFSSRNDPSISLQLRYQKSNFETRWLIHLSEQEMLYFDLIRRGTWSRYSFNNWIYWRRVLFDVKISFSTTSKVLILSVMSSSMISVSDASSQLRRDYENRIKLFLTQYQRLQLMTRFQLEPSTTILRHRESDLHCRKRQ